MVSDCGASVADARARGKGLSRFFSAQKYRNTREVTKVLEALETPGPWVALLRITTTIRSLDYQTKATRTH
jgi:hypothetical protein